MSKKHVQRPPNKWQCFLRLSSSPPPKFEWSLFRNTKCEILKMDTKVIDINTNVFQ